MEKRVRARIRLLPSGYAVEVKRAKYKHWFTLGAHHQTDSAFRKALADGTVEWKDRIIENELF